MIVQFDEMDELKFTMTFMEMRYSYN